MTQVFIPKSKQRKTLAKRWRSLRYALSAPSVIANFLGRPLHVDAKDRRARKIFIRRDVIDRPDLATWLKLVDVSGWTDVVDVGANYGEFLIAIEHPENYALTAFEPNPKIFNLLSKTCQANRLDAKLENLAVGDRKGNVQLYISCRQSGASSVIEKHTVASHSVTVPQVALGEYFLGRYSGGIRTRSFLVKIDIEGNDLAAIQGLGAIVQKARDVAVLFEINSVGAAGLMQLFGDFDVFVLGRSGNWVAIKPPVTPESFQALCSEMGFDDAVVVRKSPDSEARAALLSLSERRQVGS